MKSFKVLILSLVMCCFPLFGKVYKVGLDVSYPPASFLDKNGEIAGLDIDIIKEIEKASDLKFEIVKTPFAKLFTNINEGKLDLAISFIGVTDERLKDYDFSDVYYKSKSCVYVVEKNKTIKSTSDLKGKKIAIASSGSLQEKMAKELGGEPVVFESILDVIASLKSGKTDAMIIDSLNIPLAVYGYQFGFDDENLKAKISQYNEIGLKLLETKELDKGVAILFKKGADKDLIAKINNAIKFIDENGIKAQILLNTITR